MSPITCRNAGCGAFLVRFLMSSIDKYSELTGDLLTDKLKQFVKEVNVDFEQVKEYISLFPDRVYRNIYQGGLMKELL